MPDVTPNSRYIVLRTLADYQSCREAYVTAEGYNEHLRAANDVLPAFPIEFTPLMSKSTREQLVSHLPHGDVSHDRRDDPEKQYKEDQES